MLGIIAFAGFVDAARSSVMAGALTAA